MKQRSNKFKSTISLLFFFSFILMMTNCGTIDSFDSDNFTLFDEETNGENQFRPYATKPNQPPLIEFIIDYRDSESVRIDQNLSKVCDYTKLPYQSVNMKKWNNNPVISSSTRVLCVAGTAALSTTAIEAIIDFVASGGTFFIPIATEDKRIAFLLGFKPDADYSTDITSKGFRFLKPLLPNFTNLDLNKNEVHYGFAKENFNNNVTFLATAVNQTSYPTVIENKIGLGKVILFNTRKSFEKRDRAFLFSGVLIGLEGIPYPIANVSTIFLDDFPCPLFDIKAEPIASEMNLTTTEFVKKVWWPDMLSLAKKYSISYSVMITFDYKNKVVPPFTFDQWDKNKIKSKKNNEILSNWFVIDAARNGHELAFHGYNHVQLMADLWENQDFIATSLNSVKKKWELSNFGKAPITYVPPSNHIDKEGIDQLKKNMPTLKYLCSIYNGDLKDGGNREFDMEPFNKGFFDFPRTTSGFYLSNDEQYDMQSTYLYTGVWSHFVHPDDVYQIEGEKDALNDNYHSRNYLGLGWHKSKGKKNGMYYEFNSLLKKLTYNYPQVRFLNAGDAANIVFDWRASAFSHENNDAFYTVKELNNENSISNSQYWFLYVSESNSEKVQNSFQKNVIRFSKIPYLKGYLYSIHTKTSRLTLPDLNKKNPINKNYIDQVRTLHYSYKQKVKLFQQEEQWVDDSDEKLKIEISNLKQKMDSESTIDTLTWNTYARYLVWSDRGNEVWELLEKKCAKFPIKENVLYSKVLNTIVEYPNELVYEKWLSAQMLYTPNDSELLNSYIASFYTSENQEKIKTALLNLLKVDSSQEAYIQYIQFLLTYEPEKALLELQLKPPCMELQSLATEITWLYADANQLQKAYDWSACSKEIPFETTLFWLIELKEYDQIEKMFAEYTKKVPNDTKIMAIMCAMYHEIGKFKEAWILANSMEEGAEKENLRANLNKDVLYVEAGLQQELINEYPLFFYPDVLNSLIRMNRKEKSNFIAIASSLETNRQNASALKNLVSYNFLDKKSNIHSIATTHSKMYHIAYEIDDIDNNTHTLFGLQYQFNNSQVFEKLQYWSRIRAEFSDTDDYYFQLGMGATLARNKWFRSAELKFFPVETGPGYSKNIYQLQGNFYQDGYLFKFLNVSLSLEADYYLPSKKSSVAQISESYQISSIGKIVFDDGREVKSKLLPFIETAFTTASIGTATVNPSSGYPYWIIPKRFFAGGGLGWKFGKTDSNFTSRVEVAWFYDDYSEEFKRFIGELSYQIFDYTAITTSFEFYNQSEFYSNAIQFGVKYNLKRKSKK